MNRFIISYLSFFISSLLIFGQYEKDLIAPLEIPFSLSGTFGEPRDTHFHLGLDIRTQGKEGWEVKSISSGRVSRIRISLGGYGKAIYIDHALDGKIAETVFEKQLEDVFQINLVKPTLH